MKQQTTSTAGRFLRNRNKKTQSTNFTTTRPKRFKKKSRILKDGSESESSIQAKILSWLETTGLIHWRQNSGKIFVRKRLINLGPDGVSDIIIILPPNGRIMCMEVKSAKGTLRPVQKEFRQRIQSVGGWYCVVRSLQDAQKELTDVAR